MTSPRDSPCSIIYFPESCRYTFNSSRIIELEPHKFVFAGRAGKRGAKFRPDSAVALHKVKRSYPVGSTNTDNSRKRYRRDKVESSNQRSTSLSPRRRQRDSDSRSYSKKSRSPRSYDNESKKYRSNKSSRSRDSIITTKTRKNDSKKCRDIRRESRRVVKPRSTAASRNSRYRFDSRIKNSRKRSKKSVSRIDSRIVRSKKSNINSRNSYKRNLSRRHDRSKKKSSQSRKKSIESYKESRKRYSRDNDSKDLNSKHNDVANSQETEKQSEETAALTLTTRYGANDAAEIEAAKKMAAILASVKPVDDSEEFGKLLIQEEKKVHADLVKAEQRLRKARAKKPVWALLKETDEVNEIETIDVQPKVIKKENDESIEGIAKSVTRAIKAHAGVTEAVEVIEYEVEQVSESENELEPINDDMIIIEEEPENSTLSEPNSSDDSAEEEIALIALRNRSHKKDFIPNSSNDAFLLNFSDKKHGMKNLNTINEQANNKFTDSNSRTKINDSKGQNDEELEVLPIKDTIVEDEIIDNKKFHNKQEQGERKGIYALTSLPLRTKDSDSTKVTGICNNSIYNGSKQFQNLRGTSLPLRCIDQKDMDQNIINENIINENQIKKKSYQPTKTIFTELTPEEEAEFNSIMSARDIAREEKAAVDVLLRGSSKIPGDTLDVRKEIESAPQKLLNFLKMFAKYSCAFEDTAIKSPSLTMFLSSDIQILNVLLDSSLCSAAVEDKPLRDALLEKPEIRLIMLAHTVMRKTLRQSGAGRARLHSVTELKQELQLAREIAPFVTALSSNGWEEFASEAQVNVDSCTVTVEAIKCAIRLGLALDEEMTGKSVVDILDYLSASYEAKVEKIDNSLVTKFSLGLNEIEPTSYEKKKRLRHSIQEKPNEIEEPATVNENHKSLEQYLEDLTRSVEQQAGCYSVNSVLDDSSDGASGSEEEAPLLLGRDTNNQDLTGNKGETYFEMAEKFAAVRCLPTVDHSSIEYLPINKSLYVAVEEVRAMRDVEINQFRKLHGGIQVRGKRVARPISSFHQAGLPRPILATLRNLGLIKPMPIQMQAIPVQLSGRNMCAVAETGSGKTLAFVLPALRHAAAQIPLRVGDGPMVLVLTPTRELAIQVYREFRKLDGALALKTAAVYGGGDCASQIARLRAGAHVVVATPGRLIDVLMANNGTLLSLYRVSLLILDEADRLMDCGFISQLEMVFTNINPAAQRVMFSATFPPVVQGLARKHLTDAVEIGIGHHGQAAKNVRQFVEVIPVGEPRLARLLQLLGEWTPHGAAIVFLHTRDAVDRLYETLNSYGWPSVTLHGGQDQGDRQDAVKQLKNGTVDILLCTSIAARGLDVDRLILVVNYHAPNHFPDYVHRVGRTGRAGRDGYAFTFLGPEEGEKADALIEAVRESGQEVPAMLVALRDMYLRSLRAGGKDNSQRYRVAGYQGKGYTFSKEEKDQTKEWKSSLRAQAEKSVQGDEDGIDTDLNNEIKDDNLDNDMSVMSHVSATPSVCPTQTSCRSDYQSSSQIPVAKVYPGHVTNNPQSNNEYINNTKPNERSFRSDGSGAPKVRPPPPPGPRPLKPGEAPPLPPGPKKATEGHLTTNREPLNKISTDILNSERVGWAHRILRVGTGMECREIVEINDYPEASRFAITQFSTLTKLVEEEPGITLKIQGRYVPPGEIPPPGEERLYIEILGTTAQRAKVGKELVYSYIEETSKKTLAISKDIYFKNSYGRYARKK